MTTVAKCGFCNQRSIVASNWIVRSVLAGLMPIHLTSCIIGCTCCNEPSNGSSSSLSNVNKYKWCVFQVAPPSPDTFAVDQCVQWECELFPAVIDIVQGTVLQRQDEEYGGEDEETV